MRSLVMLGILCAANVANAEELPRFGLAVNNPIMWFVDPGNDGKAFAISGYVGVSDHIAVRANVASYPVDRIGNAASTDGYVQGSTTDVGVGAVLYQRHRFAGAFVELGTFRRSSPGYHIVGYETVGDGHKLEWAGRTLVGYSWELTRHLWIAAAVGCAVGHETGEETETGDDFNHPTPVMRTHLDHWVTGGEWMFRIGSAF